MDIKLLRAFVTLAERGSYYSAAEILCITQPALTKQIQMLEHLLDVTLFHRGRHGAKLTSVGEQLYTKAAKLLKHHGEFIEYAYRVRKGSVGKLALGFGISSFHVAPAWVNTFREQFPNIEVSLNDMPSDVQCRLLLEGQLQAGFIRLPVTKPLKAKKLMEEKLVLGTPSGMSVDSKNIQPILDMHQLLHINPLRGLGLADQTNAFLKDNNLKARSAPSSDDIHTLLALIATGNGVALLPSGASHFLPVGVKLTQLEGKQTKWQIGLVWNSEIQDSLRDKFLDIMIL